MGTTIGKRIRLLREEKGLNQIEFAKILNIANSTLSQYEAGNRVPSDDIKLKIAEYFDVSLDYLAGLSDDKTKSKEYTEEEIITMAAHKLGYGESLTDYEIEKIKLAFQLALLKNNNKK